MSVLEYNQENDPVFQNSPIKAKGHGPTAKQPAFVFTPSKAKTTPIRESKTKPATRSPLQPLTKGFNRLDKSPTNSPQRLLTPKKAASPAKLDGTPVSNRSLPKTQITPSTPSPSRKFLKAQGGSTPSSASHTNKSSSDCPTTPEDFEKDPRLSPQASLALTTRYRQLATRTPPPSPSCAAEKPKEVAGEEVKEHPLTLPPVEYDKFGFEIETPIKSSRPSVDPVTAPATPTPLTYSRTFARPSIPTPLRTNSTALWDTILGDWNNWQDDRLKSLIVLKVPRSYKRFLTC